MLCFFRIGCIEGLSRVPLTDELRLFAAQTEVWTAHEMAPENPQFNCAGYLDLRGSFSLDLFEKAVEIVDGECEALRLQPRLDSRGVSARMAEPGHVHLEVIDLAPLESAEPTAQALMEEDRR